MGFRYANLQYTAAAHEAESLAVILPMVAEACGEGAAMVGLPECANRITAERKTLLEEAEVEAESRSLAALREAAAQHGCWMLIGSLILRGEDSPKNSTEDSPQNSPERLVNRGFLIAPDGTCRARYDKIHMFDANIDDGQQYRESALYRPGTRAVVAATPLGRIGMTICYDMRFPGLYRSLARGGAQILAVPAAFTRPTGAAHWHSLLRARAIENGCFVVAPAQTGVHDGGRKTWGHSLIINPWGEILADAGESPSVTMAEINLQEVASARHAIPSLDANPAWHMGEA